MVNKGSALHPQCITIAIGSLPYSDPEEAVEAMLKYTPVCPGWPQLPKVDFREGMYIQYAEGMPAAVVDEVEKRIWFDSEKAPEEMAFFYENYLAGNVEYCAISPEYARGLDLMIKRLPVSGASYIKGQVTGPISFGLSVTDAARKPVLYNEDLYEAVVKTLALKGQWQVERFREAAPEQKPVIFYDEPYLTQVGSAMVSLPREQVVANLNECYEAIDGYTGTHVCGGTDWGLLASTSVDILHFDAFEHTPQLLVYEKELSAFMERGGVLAWGIAPTGDEAFEQNARELAQQVMSAAEKVAGFGADLAAEDVLNKSFISQSCGLGSRDENTAERCLSLAAEISDVLRAEIC